MTPNVEAPQAQHLGPLWEGEVLKKEDVDATETTEDEEMDILEIIEERSQGEDDTIPTTVNEEEDSLSRPSTHEFSLTSLGSALGGAFQASTTNLGAATASFHSKGMEKLRESFSNMQVPSPRELADKMSDHSSRGTLSRRSDHHVRSFIAVRNPRRRVDFGEFQPRAERLQYTQEDIFTIASDPVQMQELRLALRSLGAVTDSLLKQKLHWYVKNSKRARREAEEREQERLRQEEMRKQEEKQSESEVEPTTPPMEQHKVIDGYKVLEQAAGAINPEDPSPKCVRGIFVPPS